MLRFFCAPPALYSVTVLLLVYASGCFSGNPSLNTQILYENLVAGSQVSGKQTINNYVVKHDNKAVELGLTVKYLHIPSATRTLFRSLYRDIISDVSRSLGKRMQLGVTHSYCDIIRVAKFNTVVFDVVFLPPHVAPQFIRDGHLVPLVYTSKLLEGVFMRKDIQYPGIDVTLRVGTGDPLASVTYYFEKKLEQIIKQVHNASRAKTMSFDLVNYSSHSDAIVAFAKGEVDAIAVAKSIFDFTKLSDYQRYQTILFTGDTPNVVILARSDLSKDHYEKIQRAFAYDVGIDKPTGQLAAMAAKAADAEFYDRFMQLPEVDLSACYRKTDPIPDIRFD